MSEVGTSVGFRRASATSAKEVRIQASSLELKTGASGKAGRAESGRSCGHAACAGCLVTAGMEALRPV